MLSRNSKHFFCSYFGLKWKIVNIKTGCQADWLISLKKKAFSLFTLADYFDIINRFRNKLGVRFIKIPESDLLQN